MTTAPKDWENRIGRRLKLRDLHILSAVVQWGSMAKAATHLSMTQPAVSDGIANLEDTLGVRLLDRSPRGVEPTTYANVLLKRGLVVFDELRAGIRDIEFLANPKAGEVRVGCPEALAAGLVPAIIDRLSRRYPRVDVHVVHAETATLELRELREREVDLLVGRILRPLDDDIDAEVLFEERRFVVAGARSRWAGRRKLALSELAHEPWILDPSKAASTPLITNAFRAHGLELPRRNVTTFSVHVRSYLLATGRLWPDSDRGSPSTIGGSLSISGRSSASAATDRRATSVEADAAGPLSPTAPSPPLLPDLPSPSLPAQGGRGYGGQLAPAQEGPNTVVFVGFPRALGHLSQHALRQTGRRRRCCVKAEADPKRQITACWAFAPRASVW